jgi:hypothetical protein
VVRVYLRQWNKLEFGEQDFAIARSFLDRNMERPSNQYAIRTLIGIACSTLACVNLWFILPLHSANLVLTSWRVHWLMRKRTIELDRRAVEATGNLESAKKLIRRSNTYTLFISGEERIRRLTEVLG